MSDEIKSKSVPKLKMVSKKTGAEVELSWPDVLMCGASEFVERIGVEFVLGCAIDKVKTMFKAEIKRKLDADIYVDLETVHEWMPDLDVSAVGKILKLVGELSERERKKVVEFLNSGN